MKSTHIIMRPFSNTLLAIILLVSLLSTCSKKEQEVHDQSKKPYPRHIILIGIDTLRADHLSCYNYPIKTSPSIDAFAQNATVFEQSISSSSWTLPSFASILTGLYHHEHLAGIPCKKNENDKRDFPHTILIDSLTTLAEVLKKQGYTTAAFTEGGIMSPEFGFAQGFEFFKVCSVPEKKLQKPTAKDIFHKNVKNVVDSSLEWIRKNRDKNFFLFLHTYEPHIPLKDPLNILEEMKNDYKKFGFFDQIRKLDFKNVTKDAKYTEEDGYNWLCNQRMLYDCEIRYTDYHMGRFLSKLKKLGIFEDSLIIITSDHGTEFGEHGGMNHGNNLYQESIFVPMIIKQPKQQKGARISEVLAEGIDIFPTIMEACGINTGHLKISGGSLVAPKGEKAAQAHLFKHEINLAVGIQNKKKMIFNYAHPETFELFDLGRDLSEKSNLFGRDDVSISQFIDPVVIPKASGIPCFGDQDSSQIKEQLKSLGYIE